MSPNQLPIRKQKAEQFNYYFNTVFTASNFIIPPPDKKPTPTNQLNHLINNPTDVYVSFIPLNTPKVLGPDDITPFLPKSCAVPLTLPLTYLLNTCLQSCSLRDEWKVHKIIPIPKGFDPSDVRNYRPISLLCIPSKILESLIYNKIIDFICPWISRQEFDFLSKCSCLSSYSHPIPTFLTE